MYLIQADGSKDLNDPSDNNSGNPGDPFPGTSNTTELLDIGENISTSFESKRSGVSLRNITFNVETKQISLDVVIED
jgi:immune inhibitor A